ncbi:MAG: ABC transporter permease subunit [Sumerlaeia bacterium]
MSLSLRQTGLIAGRELRSLFTTPLYWVSTGVFFLAASTIFVALLFDFARMGPMRTAEDLSGNITIEVIEQLFAVIHFFLLVQIPLLTMRSFAEERRQGTLSLLTTTPVGEWSIVLGKFIAYLTVLGTYLLATLAMPLFASYLSDPEWPVVISCYTALVLAACAYVALGLFYSALTESQVIAAVLTYTTLFGLLILSQLARSLPTAELVRLAEHLTLLHHVEGFIEGQIQSASVAWFLLFSGLCLFLAVRQVESLRWRS